MNGSSRFGWGYALAAALFGIAIAMLAYNAGIADGAASAAADSAVRGFRWGWHGPGFLWPLFWVAFLVFIFRGACWRRHYWYGGPYRPYGPGPPADDDEFDRWHRRAHERMTEERPADDSGLRR